MSKQKLTYWDFLKDQWYGVVTGIGFVGVVYCLYKLIEALGLL